MSRDFVIDALLILGAVIHLPPVVGVLGVRVLERGYDVKIVGPDLALLMRHRAVLFGILGGLLVWAVLDHELRPAAVTACLVSDVAFAGLFLAHRDHNATLGRLLRPDLVSIVALGVAAVLLAT